LSFLKKYATIVGHLFEKEPKPVKVSVFWMTLKDFQRQRSNCPLDDAACRDMSRVEKLPHYNIKESSINDTISWLALS